MSRPAREEMRAGTLLVGWKQFNLLGSVSVTRACKLTLTGFESQMRSYVDSIQKLIIFFMEAANETVKLYYCFLGDLD
jgi:hypothetical protein